ncbi:hypothetical protein M0802_008697 [Mischocyttarus mexicanus]|nr:hypothetical protein M0802_008697 [Mischocyttarus mexicanus]
MVCRKGCRKGLGLELVKERQEPVDRGRGKGKRKKKQYSTKKNVQKKRIRRRCTIRFVTFSTKGDTQDSSRESVIVVVPIQPSERLLLSFSACCLLLAAAAALGEFPKKLALLGTVFSVQKQRP